jgi:ATP-dependent DNA helicase RecG
LTPVYPSTEGISQAKYRSIVDQVIELLARGRLITELLGNHVDSRFLEMPIDEALILVHRPPPDCDVEQLMLGTHPAQQRLAFEELLAHNVSYQLIREEVSRLNAYPIEPPGEKYGALIEGLEFSLTSAQRRVADEIDKDMRRSVPMLRLLQGDVGSGKTVVAALAAVQAIESGLQAAIMAPTEILAEQHFINLSSWFSTLGISTAWLSGKVKGKRRDEQLALIETGTAGVVIGTHALFQESVAFDRLGLVIIDEQHRFGVHQRLALQEKGEAEGRLPHQLVMTATPIPRTLTMSVYADMDSSILDELPPGRTPVTTSILADARRDEVIERVQSACSAGAQAYWVCTLIEESEVLQGEAAEATAIKLREALSGVRVALVHGRMTPADKTRVMNEFKDGTIDLLVATTVIEVGVDVPNASLMIIENAERLGLAQLHQLRGRTGRGTRQSYCVLMYHPPLGESSKRRLNIMRGTNDGFVIAEEDLKIRGPGELLGSRQSGAVSFRIADLMRDGEMLTDVRKSAGRLFASDREKALAILQRWISDADRLSTV